MLLGICITQYRVKVYSESLMDPMDQKYDELVKSYMLDVNNRIQIYSTC